MFQIMSYKIKVERIALLAGIILMTLFMGVASSWAWKISFSISVQGETDMAPLILKAGLEPGATDGVDYLWDVSSFPPLPGQVKQLNSYFLLPSDSSDKSIKLMKDIRDINNDKAIWNIQIESIPPDREVHIGWDLSDPSDIHGKLLLKDINTGTTVDLLNTSEYKFLSTQEGTRSIQIMYTKASSSSNPSSGSGFGCGLIKGPEGEGPSGNNWNGPIGVLILFSPFMLKYLLRRRSS